MQALEKITKAFTNIELNVHENVTAKSFVPPQATAKHEVIQSSMSESKLNNAVTWAKEGFCLHKDTAGVASHLRDKLNEEYGGHWSCCIGDSFKVFCTYKNNGFAEFRLANNKISIFMASE